MSVARSWCIALLHEESHGTSDSIVFTTYVLRSYYLQVLSMRVIIEWIFTPCFFHLCLTNARMTSFFFFVSFFAFVLSLSPPYDLSIIPFN